MTDLYITLIQSDLSWENKAENLSMFSEKINAISGKKQVILLPEMFSTGFSMTPEKFAERMDGSTVQWMRDTAAQHKIILGGSVIIEENGHYFNRFMWMQPNGTAIHYDKRHLFGYAGEDKHYTAGAKRVIVSVNGWKILLQVCYDLRFPVWARQQPMADENFEYDAILYVANWPERRGLPWKTLLQARAIENQSFVIGLNRVGNDGNEIYHSGDSRVIDPWGNILYEKSHEEDTFTAILEKNTLASVRQKFPFAKDADGFNILM